MEKINLVELLKDCPEGMELDCAIFNHARLEKINSEEDREYPIRVNTLGGCTISLTKYGTYIDAPEAKCVIFPKGKTTWEGFQRPFKDGDIIAFDIEEDSQLFIFKEYIHNHDYAKGAKCYMMLDCDGEINFEGDYRVERFATEEEKERLFQAIKNNGYRWNAETKTLEKLPEFMIGDRIKHEENGNILNYKTINSMEKKNFCFGVHCRNASETMGTIDRPCDDLFRDGEKYSDLFNYFAEYLNAVEEGPHIQFKGDANNPYSGPNVDGFEEYLYHKQNGIFIQFEVENGKLKCWSWDDVPNDGYKYLEYSDFKSMIEQDIYKSDSTKEKIITSDIVDKYCNGSNINNDKTEDIATKSKPEVNFDILFDYGEMISIGGRFVRKSDISAIVREECDVDEDDEDDYERYFTVVILKNGTKLTFHDIDYEEFVAELDKYYRFKGDIFK